MGFLQDSTFLQKVNKFKKKTYYASIDILDFETEKMIAHIGGKVVSANINIAANSVTRRSGSLTMLYTEDTYNITELTNLISIDKKIRLSLGINNPYSENKEYSQYGDTLWFKQGIFFITAASISRSTSSNSVNINFIDKMGKLNGVCGGTFPATVNLHEEVTVDANGKETYTYPLIKDIIYNLVHFYGGEDGARIVIEDVPDTGRQVIRYTGSDPLYVKTPASTTLVRAHRIGESYGADNDMTFYKDDLVGYYETPLTYPGELIMKAGSTVTQALDSIKSALGNFEYFYDVDGDFRFRRIKDYGGTGEVSLNYNTTLSDFDFQSSYFRNFADYGYYSEFSDLELISQISFSPKYDNIKNDFICWGTKTNLNNQAAMARYHLAIDDKPKYYENCLCFSDIFVIKDLETQRIIRYQADDAGISPNEIVELYSRAFSSTDGLNLPNEESSFNWREELYRKALICYGTSSRGSYYDEELIAAWRNVFNPENEDFKKDWELEFPEEQWMGYNPAIKADVSKIKYWLDIIDSTSPLGKYSVNRIGRRTKVVENSKISDIFPLDIPDLVFVDLGDAVSAEEKRIYYSSIGQDFTLINEIEKSNFSFINSFNTCYEEVRQMLYSHLVYQSSISLNCIPILYLDVNRIARINLPDLGITNDFLIGNISMQIGQSASTMSLQLNEAITIN